MGSLECASEFKHRAFRRLTLGPRVIGAATRQAMREVLAEVRSGQFAREWADQTQQGQPEFRRLTDADRGHLIEQVGATLRKLMWGQSPQAPH
jgi:ketol-acid reductoisomerase